MKAEEKLKYIDSLNDKIGFIKNVIIALDKSQNQQKMRGKSCEYLINRIQAGKQIAAFEVEKWLADFAEQQNKELIEENTLLKEGYKQISELLKINNK